MNRLDLFAAALGLVLTLALAIRGTLFSHLPERRFYWRVRARMKPGEGFASFGELFFRWGRLAAIRSGGRVRPDLGLCRRIITPATTYSWLYGRAMWFRRIFLPAEHQKALIAPPRTGKSGGLADQLLAHKGPAVAYTTRADLYLLTAAGRSTLGPIHVFNPMAVGNIATTFGWDIIAGCEDPATAMLRAASIVGDTAPGDMSFWLEKSAVALAALMHMAAIGGHKMTDVYLWVQRVSTHEVDALKADPRVSPELADSVGELYSESKSADSIRMTMNRSLGWLAVPQLRDMVAGPMARPFDPGMFAVSGGTIYLITPGGGLGAVGAPLFRALTDHLHHGGNLAGSRMRYRKLVPGVFFALDEIANLKIPYLAQKLADSAGHGTFMTIVIHSPAQLREAYGEHAADAILACCGVKMILPGLTDKNVLESVSALFGTIPEGEDRTRPVITPGMIRRLPDGWGLVVYANRAPVVVKFRTPWNKIARLRSMLAAGIRALRSRNHAAAPVPPRPAIPAIPALVTDIPEAPSDDDLAA